MQPRSTTNPGIGELLAHVEFVRKLARQLCASDPHGAEDLAQDVWVAALERPPRSKGRLASWLTAVARNLLASRLRRLSSSQDPRKRSQAGEDISELDRAEVTEARTAVAQAVQRLRNPYREVVLLRFYDGLELAEIARRCGRPLETVRTQLRRALVQLHAEMIGERGPRNGKQMVLLAAMPEREQPLATALGGWGAAALASAAAVLLIGLGWIASTLLSEAPALEVASAAREPASIGALADATRMPSDPQEREAMQAEPLQASASQAESASSEGGASLEIEVVDPSGAPVEGARIRVNIGSAWVERASTDARGLARLSLREEELGAGGMPPGAAFLAVAADGHATVEEVLIDTTLPRAQPWSLRVGGAPATLRALAADAGGLAIDGADVVFIPAGLPSGVREEGAQRRVVRALGRTDSEGRVELERLPAGDGWIHLRHPDLGIASLALSIEAGRGPERELRFEPGAIVHGILVGESGAARAGVRLSSQWRTPFSLPQEWTTAVSAADGSYSLALPAVAGIEVWAIDGQDQGLQVWRFFDLESGARVEWNAALVRWDPVRVRLVDLEGAPLARWQVGMRFPTGSLLEVAESTDGEGRVQLVLPARTGFQLEVHGPVLSAGSVPLHSLAGVQPDASLEHTIALDGQRRGLGSMTARLNPIGWTPPANLQVVVVREGNEGSALAPIDRELRFFAAGLAPGRYSIGLSSVERLLGFIAHEEVVAGQALDLGTMDVPAPAELDLTQVNPAETFELLAANPEGGLRSCGGVQGGSSPAALLLPGAFVLRKLSGGRHAQPAQETLLEAASGQRLTLGADLAVQD
jgi:RNA polymerase sigma-70 factor (ECF subfamily)